MSDLLTLGIQAAQANDKALAQKYLSQAVQADPTSEIAWLWFGSVLEEVSKKTYCYRRALVLNNDNPNTWMMFGKLEVDVGKKNKCFQHALALNPRAVEIWQNIQLPIDEHVPELAASPSPAAPHIEMTLNHAAPKRKSFKDRMTTPFWSRALVGFVVNLLILVIPSAILINIGYFDSILGFFSMIQSSANIPGQIYNSPQVFLTSTPMQTPVADLQDRLATAQPLLDEVKSFMEAGDCASAVPLLNQIIAIVPDSDEALYDRAKCYFAVSQNSTTLPDIQQNLFQSIRDNDAAIQVNPSIGNYYATRGMSYMKWAMSEELNVNRFYLYEQSSDNLTLAQKYGSDYSSEIPLYLLSNMISRGQCDESNQATIAYLDQDSISAENRAAAILNLAEGYACLGKFDEMEEVLTDNKSSGMEQSMVDLLYMYEYYAGGEYSKAKNFMQSMGEAGHPLALNSFFIKCLSSFQLGEYDDAKTSLRDGATFSVLQEGLNSYCSAMLLLQNGDEKSKTKAGELLQKADASIMPMFSLIRKDLQQTMSEQAINTQEAALSLPLIPTAMDIPSDQLEMKPEKTTTPRPTNILLPSVTPGTPADDTRMAEPTNTTDSLYSDPTDENQMVLNLESPSESIQLATGERKVLHIKPQTPFTYKKVMSIKYELIQGSKSGTTGLLIEFWNPIKRTWSSAEPHWKINQISYPSDYIQPDGDIYISLRNISDQEIKIDSLTFEIVIMNAENNLERVGMELTK
jgi:hypothetical protein